MNNRSGRYGPHKTIMAGILIILLSFVIAFGIRQLNSAAAKSSYTQAHGIRENATVTSVDNEQSCQDSPGSCSYSANVSVTLPTAVKGRTSTVAYVPHKVTYANGQSVAVLVNPEDPGYAEVPGQSGYTNSGLLAVLEWPFAALVFVIGVIQAVKGTRRLSGRRSS